MTALGGETPRHVQTNFRHAFATLGVPQQIKMDNSSAYVSQLIANFFQNWGIQHVTGIPQSPTGQATVERTHQTIKTYLQNQKKGESGEQPVSRLAKVQHVMNFLRLPGDNVIVPIVKHTQTMSTGMLEYKDQIKVMVKTWEGNWKGPVPLLTWGRGYACVITHSGPCWVPAKRVKLTLEGDSPGGSSQHASPQQ